MSARTDGGSERPAGARSRARSAARRLAACLLLAGPLVLGGCALTGVGGSAAAEAGNTEVRLAPARAESLQAGSASAESVQLQSLQPRSPEVQSVQARSLRLEPIYLSSMPRLIRRREMYRYACLVDEVLTCDCFGRVGNCECQCLSE